MSKAPKDPCALPPGREYAMQHFCPRIPGPQWDRFLETGKFPQGIQKTLDATADCHVNVMVVVGNASRHAADGAVIEANIKGYFPPGWYKDPCGPPPQEQAPTPGDTLDEFIREERGPVPLEDFGLERGDFDGNNPDLMLPGPSSPDCEIVPVPTIDVLVPLPMSDGYARFAEGNRWILAGELGSQVLRIPGSEHPLFSTGLGLLMSSAEFWSPLMQELHEFWRQAVAGWHTQGASGVPEFQGIRILDQRATEGVSVVPLWTPAPAPRAMALGWWTRDYAASHFQACAVPNHYYGGEAGGLYGTPGRWRWRNGGQVPAGYVAGDGFDVLEWQFLGAGGAPAGWGSGIGAEYVGPGASGPAGLLAMQKDIPEGQAPGWAPGVLGAYAQGNGWGPRQAGGFMPATGARFPLRREFTGPAPGEYLPDGYQADGLHEYESLDAPDRPVGGGLSGLGGPNLQWQEVGMGGFFDELKDIVTLKPLRKAIRWTWEKMPNELRDLAIAIGPQVANAFLPGFGGPAAKAALSVLEGDRMAQDAKQALRRAQADGIIPRGIDLENTDHLIALANAGNAPGAQRGNAPAGQADPAALLVPAGIAAAFFLL